MEFGNVIGESAKKVVSVMPSVTLPETPVRPSPQRRELGSVSSNLNKKLHVGFGFNTIPSSSVMEVGVSSDGCVSTPEEGVVQGLGLNEDISKDEPPKTEVVDNNLFDGSSDRASIPSTPAVTQSSKKRGNSGIDLNKKPLKRPKMKRHRPKIYDKSKPKKTPKSQTAKTSVPGEKKRKYVRRRGNLKASSVNYEGQEVITKVHEIGEPLILDPLTPKRSILNHATAIHEEIGEPLILDPLTPDRSIPIHEEIGEPLILDPLTPERSIPNHAVPMESPSERREDVTNDRPDLPMNLLETDDQGQEFRAKLCKRALIFSMEDLKENESEEQSPFKWGFNFQHQDFGSCPQLHKIVYEYRDGKKNLTKSQIKRSVKANSKTLDLNACTGMKDICCQLLNEVDGQYNSLKVYRRKFKPNQCVKNSRKLGPNFPKLCKKKRLTRKRRGNCSCLVDHIKVSKRSLTVWDISSGSSSMSQILRPRKQIRAAMSYVKSSKLKLPKSLVQHEKDSTTTALPFSFVVTKKKRSNLIFRRRIFPNPSTIVPQASNDWKCSSSKDASTKALIEFINQESEALLTNKCTQLVAQDQHVLGVILPYEEKNDPSKKKKLQSKVDIDHETMRMWKCLTEDDGSTEEVDAEREKWWEEERKIFSRRVNSFISIMHLVQGDRTFKPWNAKVLVSVVGAFLTQNVSDHLSSSAFMSLRAKYPAKVTSNHGDNDKGDTNISNTGADVEVNETKEKHSCVCQAEQNISLLCAETIEESSIYAEASVLVEDEIGDIASQRHDFASLDSNVATPTFSLLEKRDAFRQILESEEHNFLQQFCNESSLPSSSERVTFSNDHLDSGIKISQPETKSKKKRGKIEEKPQPIRDWDQLRKTYSSSRSRDASSNAQDVIDWEAVREATNEEVAAAIAMRGQHRVIGSRIKDLLDRLVKDHGSTDLEWLRDVPPDKAKEFLLSIRGLGLKSVECIRLLALHHHAFPVDVNVGRVAVRLGWVPLEPLPEDVQIHLLNQYPMMDSIQKYLWPRLCTLDQRTLYELHYQLITFGKVFCTKKQPNCNACPLKGECRHYASAFASARLRLPGPQKNSIVTATTEIAADCELIQPIPPARVSLPDTNSAESGNRTLNCEPTVEFPESPEPDPTEIPVRDIEDFFYNSGDGEMPVLNLNDEVFKEYMQNLLDKTESLQEGEVSQSLVALSFEAASIPMPKLKNVNRLRTEHQVYELPDSHPLLARLNKRDPEDSCPYLLAISTTGESSDSSEQPIEAWNPIESDLGDVPTCSDKDTHVRGTIFIPCRTAQLGKFPLNGTYFQVNEMFADHESSQCQIKIPRSWLWNLPRRTLYCGTSASSIFKGLTIEDIHRCFWKGFICVRGYDRGTGIPKPLSQRLHLSTTMVGKKKQAEME